MINLGLCKQCTMKIDSFITDICEMLEDAELTPEETERLEKMKDVAGWLGANALSMVKGSCEEDDFINLNMSMDDITDYDDMNISDLPAGDLMDMEII